MVSTMEKVSSNKIKLRMELDAGAFDEALQKAYIKMRGRFLVPGFRKGKAPRKVIERTYGEGVFYEEAFDEVFPHLYLAAADEHQVKPVGQPDVDIETIGAGQGLVVTVEAFIVPEVVLGQYKGLDIQREDDSVSEDAIDGAIYEAQKRNARETEITDRPVQDDDIVTIDYMGTIDGVPFEGGTAEKQKLTIGSGAFIPGFEEQMVGIGIDEEKDLQVTFPSDYHDEALAGKEAVFHVKVHGIRVREMPELDDEFAKDLGFETLDEYKTDIRAKLEAEAKKNADNTFENELVEAAAQNAQIDVPPPMIEREIDSMMNDLAYQMAYRGISMEHFMQYTGQTMEELREQRRESAEKRVRVELVLHAIAEAENINPSQEEIDEVLDHLAQDYQKENGEDFRSSLSERQMELVRENATTVAVIKLLRDEAKKPE